MRRTAYLAYALVLISSCGSKKQQDDKQSPTEAIEAAATGKPIVADPGSAASAMPIGSSTDIVWNEAVTIPKVMDASLDGPDTPEADPDAVIDRYAAECPPQVASEACRDLKLQVEWSLLDDMVDLRAADETLDREWYRVAARAETPQLACLGVSELFLAKDRSPADEAAILAALDNPSPSVRQAVLATQLPIVTALQSRIALERNTATGTCVDGMVDPVYGPMWAGGYPGAKFRVLATSPARRWFTTPDPVEKVIAFFAKTGRPTITESDLLAAGQQKLAAEIQRMADKMKPGEEQKFAQQMHELSVKYTLPVMQRVDNASDVRYVLIAPNIPIAIFKDDVFKATSIVALRPNNIPPDPMVAKAVPIKAFTF